LETFIWFNLRTYLLFLSNQYFFQNEIFKKNLLNNDNFIFKVKEYIEKYAKMNNNEMEIYKNYIKNIKNKRENAKKQCEMCK